MNENENNRRDDFYNDDPDVIERREQEYEKRYQGYRNEYENYGYKGAQPTTASGKPVKNRFGLKLTLAIIFTLLTGPFGIAAIVFTALQNSSYKKQEWENFRLFRILSNIFLILSGILSLVVGFVAGMFIWALVMLSREEDLMNTMQQYMRQDPELQEMVENAFGPGSVDHILSWMARMSREEGLDGDSDIADIPDRDFESLEKVDVPGMYEVVINGQKLTVPIGLDDFLQITGEKLEISSLDWYSNEGDGSVWTESESYYLYLYDENENGQVDSGDIVEGFDYDLSDGETFTWVGLDQNSDTEDVLAVFGEEYDSYDLGEYGCQYLWMTEDGWVGVIIQDDMIWEISMLSSHPEETQ